MKHAAQQTHETQWAQPCKGCRHLPVRSAETGGAGFAQRIGFVSSMHASGGRLECHWQTDRHAVPHKHADCKRTRAPIQGVYMKKPRGASKKGMQDLRSLRDMLLVMCCARM